jgi:hypothetical protein
VGADIETPAADVIVTEAPGTGRPVASRTVIRICPASAGWGVWAAAASSVPPMASAKTRISRIRKAPERSKYVQRT